MVREVSTRVCGVQDMKCYKKVEEESKDQDRCECLLECEEIEYKSEQQLKIFDKYLAVAPGKHSLTSEFLSRGGEIYKRHPHESEIEIFFKSPSFYPFILQQQLSTLDFIGYCGGSLGLFLGFSVISAVEIVYYFLLRFLIVRIHNRVEPERVNEDASQKNYLVEAVDKSTIHGFNQIFVKNRNAFERFVMKLI
jgi:hypothetical protein